MRRNLWSADIFAHEMTHPGRTWELADEAGKRLASRRAITRRSKRRRTRPTALFRIDGARTASRLGRGAATRHGRARAHPRRSARTCSCGRSSRMRFFRQSCYVSGPNELAYLAQLRTVYEHFGVPMPLMFPRASATDSRFGRARGFSKSTSCPSKRCRPATNRLSTACSPPRCRKRSNAR